MGPQNVKILGPRGPRILKNGGALFSHDTGVPTSWSKFKVQSLFMTQTHKGMANIQIQHKTHIKVVRQAR